MPMPLAVFELEPQYRDYVWGGTRLRPGQQTAEAWIVHESNKIISGPQSGKTLAEVANHYGVDLLGQKAYDRTGARFPILIKLLDCAQWLSLQVHPNNEQAVLLEGAGQFGKTEAWHILYAEPDAEIICGFKSGITSETINQSIRDGSIMDHVQKLPMKTGDTIFIPAGTVHALGPGLLVYEVQQTSDITYRVFDWNRPASSGRKLHIDQSLAVLDPSSSTRPLPEPLLAEGELTGLVRCPYFHLSLLQVKDKPVSLNTTNESFHSLTVIKGDVLVSSSDWKVQLGQFNTVLVPANQGNYNIAPLAGSTILISSFV